MHHVMRSRILALPLIAIVLALAATGCSDSDDGSGGTTTAATGGTAATSGCDEVSALKDSLTTLTGIDPVNDGTDALQSAASDVKTDLAAAASAVGSDLQPAVGEVQAGFDELETALQGISSAGGLGAAATEIGTALAKLGTALTDLTSEIGEYC